jgi:hypothetical protein
LLTHTCFAAVKNENGSSQLEQKELIQVYYDENGNKYINAMGFFLEIYKIVAVTAGLLMIVIHICNRISVHSKYKEIKEKEKDLEVHSEEYLKIEELYKKRKSHTLAIILIACFLLISVPTLNMPKGAISRLDTDNEVQYINYEAITKPNLNYIKAVFELFRITANLVSIIVIISSICSVIYTKIKLIGLKKKEDGIGNHVEEYGNLEKKYKKSKRNLLIGITVMLILGAIDGIYGIMHAI